MPTHKPRINLSVTPELYELMKRLGKVSGKSMSSAIVEILETSRPVLERVVVVGETAQKVQQEARGAMRKRVEESEAAIAAHVEAAMGQVDMFLGELEGRVNHAKQQQADERATVGGRRPPAGRVGVVSSKARRGRTTASRRRARARPK